MAFLGCGSGHKARAEGSGVDRQREAGRQGPSRLLRFPFTWVFPKEAQGWGKEPWISGKNKQGDGLCLRRWERRSGKVRADRSNPPRQCAAALPPPPRPTDASAHCPIPSNEPSDLLSAHRVVMLSPPQITPSHPDSRAIW